jgi:hypothetical protein
LFTLLRRKLAVILVLAVSGVAAFATLGDGKAKKETRPERKSLLSSKQSVMPGSFSLKSGYQFRGLHVINHRDNKYINLNSAITYQNGHTSYIVPLKKKVVLNNKIVFNPNAATRR